MDFHSSFVGANMTVQVCRACLTTECKLFDLQSNNLAEELSELTGTAVKLGDGLPRYMCSVCCALLRKGAAFRKKCRAAISTFQDYFSDKSFASMTQNDLCLLSNVHLKTVFSISNAVKIDIPALNQDSNNFEFSTSNQTLLAEDLSVTSDDTKHKAVSPQRGPNKQIDPLEEQRCEFSYDLKIVKIEIESDKYLPLKEVHEEKLDSKYDEQSDGNDFDPSEDLFLSEIEFNMKRKRPNVIKSNNEIKNEIFVDTPSSRKSNVQTVRKKPEKKICKRIGKSTIKKELKGGGRRKKKPLVKKEEESDDEFKVSGESSDSDFDEDSILQQVSKIENENAELTRKADRRRGKKHVVKQTWETKYNVKVEYLNKEEQIRDLNARQEAKDYVRSTYKCEFCYKGFMKEDSYKRHMVFHDPSTGVHVCEICRTYFDRQRSLRAHTLRHRVKFTCKDCGHVTTGLGVAKTHYEWHNGKSYGCKICGTVYKTKSTYTSHLRHTHGSLRCHICDNILANEHGRKMHMLKAHRMEISQYRCVTCSVQFTSDIALERHISETPATGCIDLRPCEYCGLNLPDKQTLMAHMKDEHKINEGDMILNEKAGGAPAAARAADKAPKPRRKRVPRPPNKKAKKHFMCEYCSKCFKCPALLSYHQRGHTGEKPFQCPMCPKKFREQTSMKIHMRTHTGEKPYKCTHCDKAFCQMGNRDRHVNEVHIRDTQYTCQSCDKSYTSKSALYLHTRTAHLNLPWPKRNRQRRTQ